MRTTTPGKRSGPGDGGRIVITAAFRTAPDLGTGDPVVSKLVENQLRIYAPAEGMRRPRRIVGEHVPAALSLVDKWIAGRRVEAERESFVLDACAVLTLLKRVAGRGDQAVMTLPM